MSAFDKKATGLGSADRIDHIQIRYPLPDLPYDLELIAKEWRRTSEENKLALKKRNLEKYLSRVWIASASDWDDRSHIQRFGSLQSVRRAFALEGYLFRWRMNHTRVHDPDFRVEAYVERI